MSVEYGDKELFARVLVEFRECLEVSQSDVAKKSGFSHSYISRLESAHRFPARETVVKISSALALDDMGKGILLMAAGFMPERPEHFFLLLGMPSLVEAYKLLESEEVPSELKEKFEAQIRASVRLTRSVAQRM